MKATSDFFARYCPNCGASVDLRGATQAEYNKGAVICPACGLEFGYSAQPKPRPGASRIATPEKAYIAGPWHRERGNILTAEGWHIANVAYTLGDETDHNTGDLIAAAPDLLEAAISALAFGMDKEARELLLEAIRRYMPDYEA